MAHLLKFDKCKSILYNVIYTTYHDNDAVKINY